MLDVGIYSYLAISFGIIFFNIFILVMNRNEKTQGVIRSFCVLSFLVNIFLSFVIAKKILTGVEGFNVLWQWFNYRQINISLSFFIDEFSISVMILLQLIALLVSIYFLLNKEKRASSLVNIHMLVLFLSAMSFAENFITFVIFYVLSGYVFNHMVEQENESYKNTFLTVLQRLSTLLMIVGLLGLFRVFHTDSFTTFKEQEVVAQMSMKGDVIVYGIIIVTSFLLKWFQVPFTYLLTSFNRYKIATEVFVSWSLQMVAGLVLASRISVIFVSLDQVTTFGMWFCLITLVCAGSLAFIQRAHRSSLAFGMIALNSIALIMSFLGQAASAIMFIFCVIISLMMISILVDLSEDINTEPRKRIIMPPASIIVYMTIALFVLLGLIGTPVYYSVATTLKSVGLRGGVFPCMFLIVGWMIVGAGITKITIKSLLVSKKNQWSEIYQRKDKIIFFLCSIVSIFCLVLYYLKLDPASGIDYGGFIAQAIYGGEFVRRDDLLFSYIVVGIISIIPAFGMYYLYVMRADESLPKKFEDSFPALIEWLQNELYMEKVVRFILFSFLLRIMNFSIRITNNVIPKMFEIFGNAFTAGLRKVLVIESEEGTDGIIAIVSVSMVLIIILIMFKFIY